MRCMLARGCTVSDEVHKPKAGCAHHMLLLLLQAKQEMQQGRKRQLALPHSEQEGADAVEAVVDTKVSTTSISAR